MTEEQINTAIALHLGWKSIVSYPDIGVMGIPPSGNSFDPVYIRTKMWTTDLNAMHEAEGTLDEEQWMEYIDWMPQKWEAAVHATARQRAEAFLRAIGKWEEVQG